MRSENSRTRAVPVPTSPALFTTDVILPKLTGVVRVRAAPVPETLNVVAGDPYWARLKRLNASARKITLFRSVTWKVFSTLESSCQSGGPVATFFARLPQGETPVGRMHAPVRGHTAGRLNAAGL